MRICQKLSAEDSVGKTEVGWEKEGGKPKKQWYPHVQDEDLKADS